MNQQIEDAKQLYNFIEIKHVIPEVLVRYKKQTYRVSYGNKYTLKLVLREETDKKNYCLVDISASDLKHVKVLTHGTLDELFARYHDFLSFKYYLHNMSLVEQGAVYNVSSEDNGYLIVLDVTDEWISYVCVPKSLPLEEILFVLKERPHDFYIDTVKMLPSDVIMSYFKTISKIGDLDIGVFVAKLRLSGLL